MLPVFPTLYSTLSPSALGAMISEKYELKDLQCQFLLRGVGDTYLAATPDTRYILRIYRSSHRSLSQVRSEIDLLLALQQAELPVSYPIPDRSGGFIQTLPAAEGPRYAVLFTFAPGHSVSILQEDQLRDLGRQMARFHLVSSAIELEDRRWEFDLATTLFQPLAVLRPYFAEDPEGYAWLQQAIGRVSKKLTQIAPGGLPSGYCHFDFLPKNFHFEGDKVTFFDFDFVGYGWLANDIMTFWQHLCLDVYFGRMTQEAADKAYTIFLDAYRAIRPLSEDELAAVPWLSLGFWLFYMAFHTTHDQFYSFVQPAHLKLRMDLLRKLMEKYWEKE